MSSPVRNRNFSIGPPQIRRGARVTPIWNRYPEVLPVPIESNNDLIGPLFPNANYNEENANANFSNNPFVEELEHTEPQPHFNVEYKVLPSVNIHANEIEVFDLLMGESTIVNVNNLDKDLVYFKSKNSYFSLPIDTIANDINNNENIFFKCNKELSGAPRVTNVHFDTPYYLLRLNGNFLVSYSYIYNMLNEGTVFDLIKEGHSTHVASYDSVIMSTNANGYPLSFRKQQVNIVSADHCQDGTARDIYILKSIKFLKPRRRSTRLATKKAKKGGRRTYHRRPQ
jgi:hypothetical protein